MKIETKKISDLKPAPYNPRTISEHSMKGLKASIERFGLVEPIVWNKRTGNVVGGHQRLKVLEEQREKKTQVVVVDLPAKEEKALNVTLNNPHVAGEFMPDLQNLLGELKIEIPEFDALNLDELYEQEPNGEDLSQGMQVFSDDEILDEAFLHYRSNPFPDISMLKYAGMIAINKLAASSMETLRTTHKGLRIANAYHPQRLRNRVGNVTTPYEAFADDKRLKHAIALTIKSGGSMPMDGRYFSFIGCSHGAQEHANFRPGYALYIYRKYGIGENTRILDCSMGYGGRLVGFIASGMAHYVGIDPAEAQYEGNVNLAEDYGASNRVKLIKKPAEDVKPKDIGEIDVAFSSPPYFVREIYSDEDTQSAARYPEIDRWLDGFLTPMLKLQYATLRKGGYNIVNIAKIKDKQIEHDLPAHTIERAEAIGFEYSEMIGYPIPVLGGSHQDKYGGKVREEPVLVFKKSA